MTRFAAALAAFTALAQAQDFDLILRNGRILDGMGNAWYRADIGLRAGRVAAIGVAKDAKAKRVIDVNNRIVAPGFIDMMAATSVPLLLDSESGGSKLQQGITTMMAGEGASAAPQNAATFRDELVTKGYKWTTFAEYHALLAKKGLPLNVVHNVGAAQIRRVVIGDTDREPTPAELGKMRDHVAQAMRAGAMGLSTALIYPPGTYAKTAELVEMAKVAGQYGGFYSTHMRNESAGVLEAIREALEIGEKANVPVHIYHLKAAGEENWPLMRRAVDLIQSARDRGMDVTADIYPYIRNGLGIAALIHPRHLAAGAAPFLRTLADPAIRASLRREVESTSDWENWYRHVGKTWANILIAESPKDRRLEGKSVAEAATILGRDEWTTFFDLVAMNSVSVNPKSMNEEQKRLALRTEWVSLCTDAEPVDLRVASWAHPRAFGSFPRVLGKYVREEKVISLETAIRKMTSLPANRLRQFDRGRIAPGMAADVVVFDPDRIADTATFEKPMAFPVGFDFVIVNGVVAVDHGKWSGALPGKVLRLPS